MTGTGPLISVVMPAYKVGPFIGEALASVAAQSYLNWEVLVVDDHGPDDGMVDIVRGFAAEHPTHRVELITHEVNKGVSAARNTAIAAAKGELVAFLDPDDLWSPDHLAQALRVFRERPGIGVVSGPVGVFKDEPGEEKTRITGNELWRSQLFPFSLALHNFIQPSATVVLRSALQGVGGFDTDPGLQHIEDYDLWIRLAEHGYQFAFLKRPTSQYRKHDGGATANINRMDVLHENLMRKHHAFFQRSRSALDEQVLAILYKQGQELAAYRSSSRGPLMRVVRAIDRIAMSLWRSLGKGGRASADPKARIG